MLSAGGDNLIRVWDLSDYTNLDKNNRLLSTYNCIIK